MKKLLFFLFAITIFACGERKVDPQEAVILEFLDKLKTEKVSAELLHSKYFLENKFENEATVDSYLHIFSEIKEMMKEGDDVKVMSYAEAQFRSEQIPYIDPKHSENVYVIKIRDKYVFCLMNGDKIESMMPLVKIL